MGGIMQFDIRKSLRSIFQNSYDSETRPKDNLSNSILNSGVSHEANSQAMIGWAKVPPDFPCIGYDANCVCLTDPQFRGQGKGRRLLFL